MAFLADYRGDLPYTLTNEDWDFLKNTHTFFFSNHSGRRLCEVRKTLQRLIMLFQRWICYYTGSKSQKSVSYIYIMLLLMLMLMLMLSR